MYCKRLEINDSIFSLTFVRSWVFLLNPPRRTNAADDDCGSFFGSCFIFRGTMQHDRTARRFSSYEILWQSFGPVGRNKSDFFGREDRRCRNPDLECLVDPTMHLDGFDEDLKIGPFRKRFFGHIVLYHIQWRFLHKSCSAAALA